MDKKVIWTVIDQVATLHGNRVAVEQEDGYRLSYAQVKTNSDALAALLQQHNISKGSAIGVFLPSGAEYIVSILGVNKAGALFVPLAPDYPAERLKALLRFIEPSAYITNTLYRQPLDAYLAELGLSSPVIQIPAAGHAAAAGWMPAPVSGNDSSYLLYTSGSTGEPKVIEGINKSLSHFIFWEAEEFKLDDGVKTALLAPTSFDVSLRDIFVPLIKGGTVFIPSGTTRKEPALLLAALRNAKVNLLHIVPSVLRLCIDFLEKQEDPESFTQYVRHLLLAGEPLYYKDLAAWQKLAGKTATLVNLYGPTETTLAKVFNRIAVPENEQLQGIVPLGNPISQTMVLILKNDKICQIGETGEICIKTPFRSKGYYRNPELTREKFCQNPLHADYEDIIYRTGDLGRYLPDRSIAFAGRSDSQVKIRGNRVETAEVEGQVQRHHAVRQALVVPVQKESGEVVLVCYYIPAAPVTPSEMRSYLTPSLPDYMLPSYFIPLDSFPVNINGKVNRKALPVPEEVLYEHLDYTPPAGDMEALLCKIWSEVLSIKRVGVNNSFFELGGHSLNAVKVVSLIHASTGKQVTLKTFFEYPAIRLLAPVLTALNESVAGEITPVPPSAHYEVSHSQKRLLILNQQSENLHAYNMVGAYFFRRAFNTGAFRKAFAALVERHESLRTSFVLVNGHFRQKIELADFTPELYDGPDTDITVDSLLEEELHYHFDVARAPLLRAKLLQLPGGHFFIINLHHIISDGWSMKVIIQDLLVLYKAFCGGAVNPLPPLNIQYKDYTSWFNKILAEGGLDHQKKYWHNRLSDLDRSARLPTDFPRPATVSYRGENHEFVLGREETDKLKKLAGENKAGFFSLLLSVIKLLLYTRSGIGEVVTGIPVAGRNHPQLEEQIGFYLNNLVIRAAIDPNDTFLLFMQRVQQLVEGALANQDYPFDRLVEELGDATGGEPLPLYHVLVVMNNRGLNFRPEDMKVLQDEFGMEPCPFKPHTSKLDLTFFLTDEEALHIDIEYNIQLFKASTLLRFEHIFRQIVNMVLQDANCTTGDLTWQLSGASKDKALQNKINLIPEDF